MKIIDRPDLYKRAIERQEYKNKGGKICCGHDFWDKQVEIGQIVMCTRCAQYFIKASALPWLVASTIEYPPSFNVEPSEKYDSNHLETTTFWYPIDIRMTKERIKL